MVLVRRGRMMAVSLMPVLNDKCEWIVRRLSKDSKLLSASTGIELAITVARKLHQQGFRGYHLAGVVALGLLSRSYDYGPLEEQRSLRMQPQQVY